MELGLRMNGHRGSLPFDGLVSGIRNHSRSTAARATAAMPRNPAAWPRLLATRLESVVLSEAQATKGPKPDNAPARSKLTASRPRKLASEGDGSVVSDTPTEFAATTMMFRLRQLVTKAPAMGILPQRRREIAVAAIARLGRDRP